VAVSMRGDLVTGSGDPFDTVGMAFGDVANHEKRRRYVVVVEDGEEIVDGSETDVVSVGPPACVPIGGKMGEEFEIDRENGRRVSHRSDDTGLAVGITHVLCQCRYRRVRPAATSRESGAAATSANSRVVEKPNRQQCRCGKQVRRLQTDPCCKPLGSTVARSPRSSSALPS